MQASNLPTKVPLPFANAGAKNTIPLASQIGITPGAASLTDGFPPDTRTPLVSGGVPPSGADMNGILNLITGVQQWQSAGGIFKYDSAFSTSVGGYPKGAILESSDGSTIWLCLADNNTTDPDGATPANWAPAAAYGIAAIGGLTNVNVTLTPAQYSKPIITLSGTLTGNVQIIVPLNIKESLVANNTVGPYSITIKGATGSGAIIPQGFSQSIYCDGTNVNLGAITKGYADTLYGPIVNSIQNFRLSTNTGVPVTTTDKTAATVIYMVPYKGWQISLYDGTANWKIFNTTEKSISVPATTSTMYDVFAYDNGGVVALELAAWTNDTTRATALTTQDGVLVKSGATTRRYLGSFRTTGVSGQTEDSRAKRYVWNYYNRVPRDMSVTETTASWTYQTSTYRQANGNANNQLDFIVGVSEDRVDACLSAAYSPASSTAVYAAVGFDNVTSPSSDAMYIQLTTSTTGPWSYQIPYSSVPASGRHYITWLEAGSGGTITWYGYSNGNYQYGLKGTVLG